MKIAGLIIFIIGVVLLFITSILLNPDEEILQKKTYLLGLLGMITITIGTGLLI